MAALPGLSLHSSFSSHPIADGGLSRLPCLHRQSSLSSSPSPNPCPGTVPGRSGGAAVEGCCRRGGDAWLHPRSWTQTCRSSALCRSWGGFLGVAGPKSHPWGSSMLLGCVTCIPIPRSLRTPCSINAETATIPLPLLCFICSAIDGTRLEHTN